MLINTKEKNQEVKGLLDISYKCFVVIVDLIISIYMVLILIVLPFYHQDGYNHIGTDKSEFFRGTIKYCGRAILPIIIICCVLKMLLYVRNHGNSWLIQCRRDILKYCREELSITDFFALSYGVVVVLSYVCTDYKEVAFLGAKGWYMGMVSQLAFVCSYFCVAKIWRWKGWLVALVLPASAIVFIISYLNRFGIHPLDMQRKIATFTSTVGNINWYCGYMVILVFGAIGLFWKTDWKVRWQQWLMAVYLVIGFATLVTNGSSSGILVLLVLTLVLFYDSAVGCRLKAEDSAQKSTDVGRRMEAFGQVMLLLSSVCAVTFVLQHNGILKSTYSPVEFLLFIGSPLPFLMLLISGIFYCNVRRINYLEKSYPKRFFMALANILCWGALGGLLLYIVILAINTLSDGILYRITGMAENTIFTFSPDWGSQRGATWMAGVFCFLEQDLLHKLVGVGPDCMGDYIYTDGSSELVAMLKSCFGEKMLTNAHNEWITILANTGLLGLVSYVGMMISAMRRYLKVGKQNPIVMACAFGLMAYTINNMFSFQTSMNVPIAFIVLGLGDCYLSRVSTY